MNSKTFLKVFLILLVVSLALTLMLLALNRTIAVLAQSPDYYTVYTESDEELCTRGEEVEVGDSYISYDNKRYEIIEVDKNSKVCKAKYVEDVTMPSLKINTNLVNTLIEIEKSAGLYMTHNDESYILSDGTGKYLWRGRYI